MHRFFVDAETPLQPGATLLLPPKLAHQVRVVLRLDLNEQLILLDNSGEEVVCSLTRSDRTGVEVRVLRRQAGKREPSARVILCQGLLKSARFEWILEKGTELGVTTFAPILCRRSMAGLEEAGPAKIQRWQRIIQEATEQCGRSRLPELLPIRPLMHALTDLPTGALAIMPWEEEHGQSLRSLLQNSPRNALSSRTADDQAGRADPLTVVLFIGPEGGLLAEEVALAARHGVQTVTLGTRILRAETAALAAVANVVYELEGAI